MVFVDPSLREPPAKFRAGATAERLADGHLDRAGSLADNRDAIADGSSDDGPSLLQIARGDAFRAGADASVKLGQPTGIAGDPRD